MKLASITFNRNDGYKEDERLLIHLLSLLDTFDEVNYVDWNSPNNSQLYNIIDKLPKNKKIKHYIIPPEIHRLYQDNIPNFPSVGVSFAINLAIRRSDSDWFCSTTIDNICPFRQELESLLKTDDTFYTISRREVEYDLVYKNINNLNEYRTKLGKTTEPRYYHAKVTPNDNFSIINCPGDFQFAPTYIWKKIKGYEENMFYACFADTNVQKKVVLNGFKLKDIYDIPMYHMSHVNRLPQGNDPNYKTHEVSKNEPILYNDPWKWVEFFKTTENDENWGLGDVDIEHEII